MNPASPAPPFTDEELSALGGSLMFDRFIATIRAVERQRDEAVELLRELRQKIEFTEEAGRFWRSALQRIDAFLSGLGENRG